jgi:hypothetical protein
MQIDFSNYGVERGRLEFLTQRDGLEGALEFAKQTMVLYRKHVVFRYVPRDNKRTFVESYLAFKRFIKDHGSFRGFIEDPIATDSDPELSDWRPIKTAPTTGRYKILLKTLYSPDGVLAYSNTWWIGGWSAECRPTHWKPASLTLDDLTVTETDTTRTYAITSS